MSARVGEYIKILLTNDLYGIYSSDAPFESLPSQHEVVAFQIYQGLKKIHPNSQLHAASTLPTMCITLNNKRMSALVK